MEPEYLYKDLTAFVGRECSWVFPEVSKKLHQYGITGVYYDVAVDALLNKICTAKVNSP
jgi:hypothetical protein